MTYNGATTARYIEPPLKRGHTYDTRFRHWYSSIADLRIREPGITNREIALRLGKHENTVGMIVGTDMFKEYFHQRREEFRKEHDYVIRTKQIGVAEAALDIVLEQLQTKRTAIPLNVALKVSESALDRLGYSPNAPTVVVDNSVHDNRQQSVSISGLSAADLEDARAALRMVERNRSGTSLAPHPVDNVVLEGGAGLDVSDVVDASAEEVFNDPPP